MNDYHITSESIDLPVGEESISAYLARPQAAGKYPGVVVLQEVFGVNEHIRDTVDRVAKMGYVAIAPALFDRGDW
jgi:carboxymethylenebutenolidase